MSTPNILFLMTDQHRWDAMGVSGDWVNTPNTDRRITPCTPGLSVQHGLDPYRYTPQSHR